MNSEVLEKDLDFTLRIWYNILTNNREVDTMTDREILEAILSKMNSMEVDISHINSDLQATKLTLENVTNKNIQLLAENFVDLTKKLNQAIPVADKNLAYEVKVNYLVEEVKLLKQEVEELKNKIA
jgi:hypothetical protein